MQGKEIVSKKEHTLTRSVPYSSESKAPAYLCSLVSTKLITDAQSSYLYFHNYRIRNHEIDQLYGFRKCRLRDFEVLKLMKFSLGQTS